MTRLTENQRKALDIHRNLAITAGAGSGKTTVLVQRYLNLLIHQQTLQVKNVLAITFTEKAAAEMKDRIFREINKQFAANRAHQGRLFEILKQLQEAQIFTIHSFCSQVLRQFPIEAEQNPEFTILTDIEIEELLNRIFRNFMLTFQPSGRPDEAYIMKALREYPIHKLKRFFFSVYQNRSVIFQFLETFQNASPQTIREFWENELLQFHHSTLQELKVESQFWANLQLLTDLPVEQNSRAGEIQRELRDLQKRMSGVDREQIHAAARIVALLTKNDGSAYSSVPGGKKNWSEEGVKIFKRLSGEAARYTGLFLPWNPETEDHFSEVYAGLSAVFTEMLVRTENLKKKLNTLDFEDLQIRTLMLLNRHPEVRDFLRKQYQFILVDEFQDTDRLQNDIIFMLVHDQLGNLDRNRLFIVGDPKQSIFGFRNTDVGLFHTMMNKIQQQQSRDIPLLLIDETEPLPSTEKERKGIIELSYNYRSSSPLIQFFNRTFEKIFTQDSPFDVPFQKLKKGRQEIQDYRSLNHLSILIDQSAEGEDVDFFHWQAKIIADRIQQLTRQTDPATGIYKMSDEGLEEISYGDIAVLIRSRTHLTRIEQTFRDYDIPYQTHKGAGFFQKQEIRDIYYILKSLLYPEDNFAFVSVLRSDYVGLSDSTLFYLSQIQAHNYWEKIQKFKQYLDGDLKETELFRDRFMEFLKKAGYQVELQEGEKELISTLIHLYHRWIPLARNEKFSLLLDEIMEKLQIRPLLQTQRDGDQKIANLNKLVHTVYEFEQKTSSLLVDLMDVLKKQMSGETSEGEAVIMAEDENKVKILTYHSAKGMEFPVVFLPFLEKPFQYNADLLIDQQYGFATDLDLSNSEDSHKPFAWLFLQGRDRQKIQAEEKRLLYVAMTRARDHLFLTGAVKKNGKIPEPSSLFWILKAHHLNEHLTGESDQIPDMPDLEIELLRVTGMPEEEKRHARQVVQIVQPEEPAPDRLKYQEPLRVQPDCQIYTVTQLMIFRESRERYLRHYYLNEGEISQLDTPESFVDEPGGALWGSLIHKLLQNFHLRKPKEDLEKIKQLLNIFPLPENTRKSEIQERLQLFIENFRQLPLAKTLSQNKLHSEFPVDIKLDGYILRGIFDLLH
ncbi:MAG: hypothetical protein EH225_00450, partial [Calditrichaeota bacterium]